MTEILTNEKNNSLYTNQSDGIYILPISKRSSNVFSWYKSVRIYCVKQIYTKHRARRPTKPRQKFEEKTADDLMDQGVINVDFNFGEVKTDSVQGQFTKQSPFHESDSGVSTMGSPNPSTSSEYDAESLNDFTDISNPGFAMFDDLMDEELAGYMTSKSPSVVGCEDILSVEPEIDVSSDFVPVSKEPGTSIKHNLRSKVVNKSIKPVEIVQKQTVSSTSVSQENKSTARQPQVKVIKVIKAPTNNSDDIDNEIYHALDDRNRKNAVQAKINREKKKAYIKSLEEDLEQMRQENVTLKTQKVEFETSTRSLKEEVAYLKNIIVNQSSLSALLQNIPNVKNVKLSSTFASRKRSAEHDHDYPATKKSRGAGVCLHVNKDNVSLEFCPHCSLSANQSDEEV